MACEKYSTWMTDAALGALAPGRESELLAHVAECDACRETYQHARDVAAFVDRSVASLVAGVPSPHFNTRLRARIAAEPAHARFQLPFVAPPSSRLFAFASYALVFATLLFVVVMSPRFHSKREPAVPFAIENQPSPSQPVVSNSPSQSPPAKAPRRSHVDHSIRRAIPHSSEPEVLVQPGQFAAVLQYVGALRAGRLDGAEIVIAQQPLEKPLELNPIEIPALDVPKDGTENTRPANNSSRL
jgi:Putative zinc-finger